MMAGCRRLPASLACCILALTLTVCYSAKVTKTFTDHIGQTKFRHLVMNNVTGHLYIGAVNKIYDLDSGLNAIHSPVESGPKKDNINCQPKEGDQCYCISGSGGDCRKVPKDSYNQALAVNIKQGLLYACSDLFYGSCSTIRISDFVELRQSYRPIISNDNSMQDSSTVVVVAPGATGEDSLYIATTRSSIGSASFTELVPIIASRKLDNFDLTNEGSSGSTSIKPVHRYKDTFKIYYKYGFSYNGFTYFLAVQKSETRDPYKPDIPYKSRIMRVCQGDNKFYSYVEVDLVCSVDGVTYNIVQSAYIGRPGQAISEGLQLGEGDQALFAVFSTSKTFSHQPASSSAVCLYSLKNIAEQFKENQRYCFDGNGRTGPLHITTPIGCIRTTFNEFECGEHAANHPIQGNFVPIRSPVAARLGNVVVTSVVAKAVDEYTVVYAGDNRGHLIKTMLYYDNIARRTQGSMFANITIDNDNLAILPDVAMDTTRENVFMMTESTVYKVQMSHCAKYTSCETCLGAGDPHCGWCSSVNRCTTTDECPDAGYVWIDIQKICPNIRNIEPENLPYTESNSASVRLTLMALPQASNNDMRCRISAEGSAEYRSRVFKTTTSGSPVLSCEGFAGLPPLTGDTASINATLTVLIESRQWISTPITIYDCSKFTSCSDCTLAPFPCGWCVEDGVCAQEMERCPSQGPIVISGAVNVPQSVLVTSSGQTAAFQDKCPSISPTPGGTEGLVVAAGREVSVVVIATKVKLWKASSGAYYARGMKCVFHAPGGDVTVDAKVTEDPRKDAAQVSCSSTQLNYVEDKGMVVFPFDVVWEFDQTLENPENVEVSVYKCRAMVNSCGACLALDPRYECGWCQTSCSLKDDCGNWLDRDAVCPNPVILRFEPSSGPINGGTKLTVHGINLGRRPEDLKNHVLVAGVECQVISEGFVASNSFKCITQPADGEISGPVSVNVIGQHYYETTIQYYYKEPMFDDLVPDRGLMTGNNLVSILGTAVGLGNEATVEIKDLECDIQWRNESHLMFKTPKVDAPMTATVRLTVDGTSYELNKPFNYVQNPQILAIKPLYALVSGGNTINVTGTNFDAVQNARASVLESLDNLRVECDVIDSTTLQCTAPSAVDLNLNIDEHLGLPLNYEFYLDELILTADDIGRTMEYKPLVLLGDPIVGDLEDEDRTVGYREDLIISVKGQNLRVLRNFPDWEVVVGGALAPWYRVGNYDNSIEIVPPAEPLYTSSKGMAEIEIRLGYWVARPGFVRYSSPGPSKVPLILGLVFGLVVPIILAVLLLVICLRRQARKNGHKGGRGMNTSNSRYTYQLPPPQEMQAEVYTNTENEEEQGLIRETPASPPDDDDEDKDDVITTDSPDYVQRLLSKIEDKKLRKAVAEVVISRDRITIGDVLGHGHFGCVFSATLKNENLTNASKVAVKTLQGDDFPPQMVSSFLEEGVAMKKFEHPHVLRLLGVGVGDNEEPMVIIPFMANGDLRTYVRNKEKSFTARQLLQLAQQVAKGMAYLASLNFVHRDLAARNCMIDEENTVKVADFGLSKNLFEKDYYSSTRDRKTKLPVKWMALESLEEFRFTIKSDVWSFGVLMWELMTRGTTPYADVDIFDLRMFLSEGRRLPKPKYCPEHVYTIMTDCWNKYPEYRPTFADLVNRLELLLNPPKKRDSSANAGGASAEPMYVNFNEFDTAEYLNPISAPPPDTPNTTLSDTSGGAPAFPPPPPGPPAGKPPSPPPPLREPSESMA